MEVYCTYCSARKKKTITPLSAIDLYKSERIKKIAEKASFKGVSFFILSGKHGLIPAHQKILHYDHLLSTNEVAEHLLKVADQINNFQISKIHFYMRPRESDPNLTAYLDCISKACEQTNTDLEVYELNP